MRRALWNDHFYQLVYSARMGPQFPGGAIKFIVAELKWLLLSQGWSKCFFFSLKKVLFPGWGVGGGEEAGC